MTSHRQRSDLLYRVAAISKIQFDDSAAQLQGGASWEFRRRENVADNAVNHGQPPGACWPEPPARVDRARMGEVDLFVWDTAGQERFRVLTPLYAHSAAALIIVALNDLDSFNNIPVWTDLLSNSCGKHPPMVLALNKINRPDQPCMSREAIKEKHERSFSQSSTGPPSQVGRRRRLPLSRRPKESVVRRIRGGCSLSHTQL
jgi:small GTP-binding protein